MSSSTKIFAGLFSRDLNRLRNELETIPEELIWVKPPGISNSCGALVLHLMDNLHHFIGSALGENGYERDRNYQKSELSRDDLVEKIETLNEEIAAVLSSLDEQDFLAPYPVKFPLEASVMKGLMHLYGHLNYHAGQLSYLHQMMEEKV